jgi:hypothetical protein
MQKLAKTNLHIDALKKTFGVRLEFTTADLLAFYRRFQPTIPTSTVNWRVYELVKTGVLERTGRGNFTFGPSISFLPVIRPSFKKLHATIKAAFPYITYCLWGTETVKAFQQHLPSASFLLIDVEKDAMQAVFDYLRESSSPVWLQPDKITLDRYILSGSLPAGREPIVVRHLISEAPIQRYQSVPTVTLEKMLVDLFTDNEFEYLQGQELLRIYQNAWERYSVNKSKLLRYAARKGQRKVLQSYLETNNITKNRSTQRDLEKHS